MSAKHIKTFLTMLLTVIFLFQCKNVVVKFQTRKRELSVEQTTVADLKFPSVTICPEFSSPPSTWSPEQINVGSKLEHWIDRYIELGDKSIEGALTFQTMIDLMPRTHFVMDVKDPFFGNGAIDMRDPNNFQPQEYNKIWTSYITPSKQFSWLTITQCLTYTSPNFTEPGHKLQFILQGDKTSWFQVFLHERESFFPSNNKLYGSELFPIQVESDRSVEYDLVARRRIAMNADPVPCHEIEPYPLFHECLDDYVERTIGCALPWRNGSNPKFAICQTSGQFLEYWTMVDHLIDWGESYLYQITGCYTKCRRHYLKVSKHNTIKAGNDGKNAVSFITFVYKEPELSIETENLAYDSLDLIGDIGGYLGLLLGVSILTVWDLCHNLGLVLVKKKNNTTWTI